MEIYNGNENGLIIKMDTETAESFLRTMQAVANEGASFPQDYADIIMDAFRDQLNTYVMNQYLGINSVGDIVDREPDHTLYAGPTCLGMAESCGQSPMFCADCMVTEVGMAHTH